MPANVAISASRRTSACPPTGWPTCRPGSPFRSAGQCSREWRTCSTRTTSSRAASTPWAAACSCRCGTSSAEGGRLGNRLSKIYTRTGDEGTTGLGDGSRVAKDDPRVEAYGCVDECNSAIGVVLAVKDLPEPVRRCLVQVQHELFDLGGELCIPGHRAI